MASSSSSKPEDNDGHEAPQWPSQGITYDEIDEVPLNVLEFLRDDDVDGMSDEDFVDSITLTEPPPSPPPAIESMPTQIGYSEAMTSVRPLSTQHYYVPDPPAHLIPPPPPLLSSPSLPSPPPSQPITCSQSIQQSTMSIIPPSLSQPPSQSQTTTTSLSPPSPTPLPSPNQTLTSPSHHTIPSPSPPPLPPSDQTIASPPSPPFDQTTTSTPLPPSPLSQSAKPKVISLEPPHPLATAMSPPPPVSHLMATPTTGAQATTSAAAESTGEMPAKRKRGRPRKEFVGERSGVEGRSEQASQEKKKRRKKKQNTQGEDKGKQPAPSFASPSPSVLFNHPNSTILGFSSCWNVIQPVSIIASQNEDIFAKIISFAMNNGDVFVLAASGQLSSLRYMETSGDIKEPTGVYEILSLSGTLVLRNEGRSRSGYLTISVVGLDGRIIGGRVCGSMIAASPIQVVGGTIVEVASDGKGSASSSDQSEALLLELNKQISSLSQEWQAWLLDTETKANERVESTEELRQAKQELEETRQLLNQTRQELLETRLSVSTTQNSLMQLFERLNIVNPPPPPHSSINNPSSSL